MIHLKKKFLPLSTAVAGMVATSSLWAANERPNIILFLVDDMGWQETSVPFHSEETPLNRRFHTPNMEKLAEKGVKFMQAYSCAISSPSRCSLMSGMNAARHRVTNWTLNYNSNNDAGGGSITLPDWNYNGIQPAGTSINNATSITSLPQILHDNGYYTIHCGKAHFGAKNTDGEDPLNFGFDVNIAGGANGGPASYLGSDNYCTTGSDFCINGLDEYAAQGMFLTEALTQEACRVLGEHLDSQSNQPFYLYMAHYAIHAPYNADSRFTSRYTGVFDEQLGQTLNSTEVNIAALVEGMDKSLGDIMTFLDDRAIAENTIILFMSDNGGQAVAPRQGRHNRDQNYPARGGKGSSYMGGVHEPMMVYWPGITVGGTENHNPVMIEDFFPTILEIAGVTDYETVQTVDGHSFVDIIKNPNIQRDRTTIWHFPNRWGESQDKNEGYGAYSAILKGDYHMIYFWENQERRLYNIKEDVGEQNNLADQSAYAQTLTELSEELTDSLIAFDAQRPTQNGEYVPWPKDAVYVETVEIGDPVTITDAIFKFSDETNKYYYSIQDNRGSDMAGPFYWTLGNHNDYKAIQVSNENKTAGNEKETQLFYFTRGTSNKSFHIYTYTGRSVDFVNGATRDSWNGGNLTPDGTYRYMQYDTESSGEFQVIKADATDYFGIAYNDGTLMNNRGTANGSAANMKWVINTYSGNSVSDSGSRYKFTLVESYEPTAIENILNEKPLYSYTKAELANAEGIRVYGLDGRYIADIMGIEPGVYLIMKDGKVSKIFLK